MLLSLGYNAYDVYFLLVRLFLNNWIYFAVILANVLLHLKQAFMAQTHPLLCLVPDCLEKSSPVENHVLLFELIL